MTTLTLDTLTLPGSLVGENPFPVFRDRADRHIHFTAEVPARYRELAGWNTGNRVLPYLAQDRYDRRKQPTPLQVAVLENDTLKATFLLPMGGRLLSLFHKPSQSRVALAQSGLSAGEPRHSQRLVQRRHRVERGAIRPHRVHLLAHLRRAY